MSFIPSAQVDVVKRPQFVEEKVEGTLPLSNGVVPTPGPVTFKSVGWGMTLGEDIAIENDKLRMLGSYDVEKQLKLGETITSEITYKPFDFKFAGYGMKKPVAPTITPPDPTMVAPNGTPGVSISILMSALIEGIEKYKIFTGVKFGGCSGEITRDGGCTFTLPFQCKDVTGWVVAPTWTGGAPNFAANPTATTPWTGISGGPDPLTIGGVACDSTSFSFNVDLGMMNYTPLGQSTFKYRKSMQRNMTVEFNALVKADNVMIGDVRGYTPRDVVYTFFPVTKKLQFTGVQFESYVQNKDASSTDFWIEELSGQASGDLVITDT
jgi:hypothetical protein